MPREIPAFIRIGNALTPVREILQVSVYPGRLFIVTRDYQAEEGAYRYVIENVEEASRILTLLGADQILLDLLESEEEEDANAPAD